MHSYYNPKKMKRTKENERPQKRYNRNYTYKYEPLVQSNNAMKN